jgi:hypothetical protein
MRHFPVIYLRDAAWLQDFILLYVLSRILLLSDETPVDVITLCIVPRTVS